MTTKVLIIGGGFAGCNAAHMLSMKKPDYKIEIVETGSILKTSTSLSSSLAKNNMKQDFVSELNNEKICPTAHSSELSQIFFETLEHTDCFYDPMSIYR